MSKISHIYYKISYPITQSFDKCYEIYMLYS